MPVSIDVGLRSRIHDLVSGYLNQQPVPVDLVEEPVVIRSGTAAVYLRLVDADPAVLRVFSPLLRGVSATTPLLTELNQLNGRISFLRLFWRDGTVYLAGELLAATLTGADLGMFCDRLADTADYYDEHLRGEFGGSVAFD